MNIADTSIKHNWISTPPNLNLNRPRCEMKKEESMNTSLFSKLVTMKV